MDLKGFNRINTVLAEAGIEATVFPRPDEGEKAKFVTLETDLRMPPANVLNALGNAGLTYSDGSRDAVLKSGPELRPLGVQPGSLTFEDKNNRR